jgi:TonB family protein
LSNETQRPGISPFSPDRRRFRRRRLKSLSYIDLGSDGGGIVTNISEAGLALHSAVALTPRVLPSIRFQLPNSPEWVIARGGVAWVNASRKQAGIRLAALPELARAHIREWIASSVDDSAGSDDSAIAETLDASLRLGGISAARDANSPCQIDDLRQADSVRELEAIDRKLRLAFANRDSAERQQSSAQRGVWWPAIASVMLLALLSFGIGWVAVGHGKFDTLSAIFAKVTGRIVTHARGEAGGAPVGPLTPLAPGAAPARPAHSGTRAVGSAPSASALPRVKVTTRDYVRVPEASKDTTRKVRMLQTGHIVQRPDPEYPPEALAKHVAGIVQLRAAIGEDGRVHAVSFISGDPILASAAEKAVRHWRYSPTLLDGNPVPTEVNITVAFSLPNRH